MAYGQALAPEVWTMDICSMAIPDADSGVAVAPDADHRSDAAAGHCPLCPISAGHALPNLPVTVTLPPAPEHPALRATEDVLHARNAHWSPSKPRGPPHLG